MKQHCNEVPFSSITVSKIERALCADFPQQSQEIDAFALLVNGDGGEACMQALRDIESDGGGNFEIDEDACIQVNPRIIAVFIWSLLKADSKTEEKKISSVNHFFKDEIEDIFSRKMKKLNLSFEEGDLDDAMMMLKNKRWIATSTEGIRTTRAFATAVRDAFGGYISF